MKKIVAFIKKEPVFCVATLLAVLSACVSGVSVKYAEYVDVNVLILLFALMAVVAGLRSKGVFTYISREVLKHCHSVRTLGFLMCMVNFFLAMLITNDVALITFVPLSLVILEGQKEKDKIMIIVLETVAANLGSMLTPIGNPQNLYLFNFGEYGVGEFLLVMLPVTVVSLVLLCIFTAFLPKTELKAAQKEKKEAAGEEASPVVGIVLYLILFAVCLLAVFHVLPHWIVLIAVTLAILIYDRRILLRVDYILLLTFVAFFIFIGNLGEAAPIRNFLTTLIGGREAYVGIAASQVFSNVPAAMLLATFAQDIDALLWGVNIGGLGTLIASMASLISYKFYTARETSRIGKYIAVFTGVNCAMLAVLVLFMVVWSALFGI